MRRRYRTPGAPVLVSIVACIAIAACQNAFGKFENPIDSLSTKYTGVPTVDTPDKIEAAKEADLSDGTNVRLTATTVFGATDYSVQVSRTANFADADILKAAMQPTNIFSIKLSDLAAGTLYWRVAAKKGGSLGPYSPAKSFVVAGSAADTVAPANVTELTAAAGNGQVTLSWTEPGDADFAGVEISAPGITAQTVAKGTAIKLINGLTNGNAYTFTVKAYDTANNKAGGATATATPAVGVVADTTAPANVTNLTATSGDGQVTLSWTEPGDADFAGVEISATGITTITVGKGTTVKVFNGLTNGTAYSFTAKAYDTANNKASGVTASGTPTVVTVAVSGVSVAPTTLSLTVGGATGTLTAAVAPTDASNKFVTWSSGDATIATVSSGVVTPVKAGTVTISAASVADGTKKGSCTVTIAASSPVSDYISPTIGTLKGVSGGSFTIGSSVVTLSGFRMSQYEITQAQYATVSRDNPSNYTGDTSRPVEMVTWYDAVEFCNKLSTLENLTPVYTITSRTPASGYPITNATVAATFSNNGYRLPTEAQWEFSARGGSSSNNYTYSGSNDAGTVAWYLSNSGTTTHPVATKAANELGLFDMSGNAGEWCWDWWGGTLSGTDPTGPSTGSYRVIRGGTWSYDASDCTVSARSNNYPYGRYYHIGFRVLAPSTELGVAITGVTLNKSTTTMTVGGATETLTAVVAPSSAANKSVTWSSSDSTIASVNSSGLVTPLKIGTATITAQSQADASKSASCVVTVVASARGYAIGDTGPAGGIVFYDKGSVSDGWRYLEAAPSDQSTNIQWYNGTNISVSTGTAIGTGKANTAAIIAAQGSGSYAASLCKNLSLGGYSDWFLPSKDELSLMYTNLNLKAAGLGGFGGQWLWASSQNEGDGTCAWTQRISDGYQNDGSYKNNSYFVCACRAFSN